MEDYTLKKTYSCSSWLYDEAYDYFIKKGYNFYNIPESREFLMSKPKCTIYIWSDMDFTINVEDQTSTDVNLDRILKMKKILC